MPGIFADSGYWIALWNPRDSLHGRAEEVARSISAEPIVTTQLALNEALDHMAGAGEFLRRYVVQMVRELEENPDVQIVSQTHTQFWDAVARYDARSDQTWSLTDCASFIVMEERGITEALAHDRDFEQAGFTALLRNSQE